MMLARLRGTDTNEDRAREITGRGGVLHISGSTLLKSNIYSSLTKVVKPFRNSHCETLRRGEPGGAPGCSGNTRIMISIQFADTKCMIANNRVVVGW